MLVKILTLSIHADYFAQIHQMLTFFNIHFNCLSMNFLVVDGTCDQYIKFLLIEENNPYQYQLPIIVIKMTFHNSLAAPKSKHFYKFSRVSANSLSTIFRTFSKFRQFFSLFTKMITRKINTIFNLRKKSQSHTKRTKLKQKTTRFSAKNQKLSSFLCFSLLPFLKKAVISALFTVGWESLMPFR